MQIETTTTTTDPPAWARAQRSLLDLQADAIEPFFETYTDSGEPYWPPDDHVGIDGGDDLYEGFYNWPLLYLVGGDDRFLDLSKRAFEGIVDRLGRAETPFGHPMAVDEYEQCRDWFHHSEGNLLFYNLSMADPTDDRIVDRAERFAGFYLPESETGNYDADRKLIRAPMTGSMGPEYCDFSAMAAEDYGVEYNWDDWGVPFHDVEWIEDPGDLRDPANAERLDALLEERASRGDVATNMAATALLANAYLLTGDDQYREWVREYVGAWCERTRANGGVVPDNVGLSGEVGEYTGAWYGGFYGWSWIGWRYLGEALATAAETAVLLTGDETFLDPLRSTLETLIDNGIRVQSGDGEATLYIPHNHGSADPYYHDAPNSVLHDDDGAIHFEDGWYEFAPADGPIPTHLWFCSREPADRDRIRELRDHETGDHERTHSRPGVRKHPGGHDQAWRSFLDGDFQQYPERILASNRRWVRERIRIIEGYDDADRSSYEEEYLQRRNPVVEEGLLQLTMGAPEPLYNGGLLHAAVRHFDPDRERPGLPPEVAALVGRIDDEGVNLTLVNCGDVERTVLTQAGACAEHAIVGLETDGQATSKRSNASARSIETTLPPNGRITVDIRTDRNTFDPTYFAPWNR